MRKIYILEPDGWPCTLSACPPGPFMYEGMLCFKSEYLTNSGHLEVFCDSGEYFWGGEVTDVERAKLMVQPVVVIERAVESLFEASEATA